MATLYKLTDAEMRTYGNFQWKMGKRFSATGPAGERLCSSSWLHAYEHPVLAVFLNPIHANFSAPRLFEAKGEIGKRDGALKVGCRTLVLVRELDCPTPTLDQRVAFAIYCVQAVCKDEAWNVWADAWLNGSDRSEAAAAARAEAAWATEAWAAATEAWAAAAAARAQAARAEAARAEAARAARAEARTAARAAARAAAEAAAEAAAAAARAQAAEAAAEILCDAATRAMVFEHA